MVAWAIEKVEQLLADQASESLTLEFKAQLPDKSDKARAELLKDVAAFANASGGTLLYGVCETTGRATAFSGLQIPDPDAEMRRLSQIIESGLEPRLSGVAFYHLSGSSGDVLVVEISESFDSPHRYLFNGHSKFVRRAGTHISELSYDQLRSAFDRSSSRIERIRSSWDKDLTDRRGWKPIIPGPMCLIRLSALASGDGRQLVDPKLAYEHWSTLIMSDWGGGSSAFNYEGLAVYQGHGKDTLGSFVQLHRNGEISAYRTARLTIDERKIIPSTTVGDFLLEASTKLLGFARKVGLTGSSVLNIGFTDLDGYEFGTRDRYGFSEKQQAGVSVIRLPEAWIEQIGDENINVHALLRPGFDLLWQSYGWSECPDYVDGRWAPKR